MRRHVVIGPDTKLVRMGGRLPRGALVLLCVQLGLFLLYAFGDGPAWVKRTLVQSADQVLRDHRVWQPLSALWLHVEGQTQALLFNMLVLWVFGSALERWWGTRRFLVFWITCGVAGLLAALVVGVAFPKQLIAGSGGSAMGMVLAFALLFPNHLAFFYGVLPLRAKWTAVILGGFLVIGNALARAYLELALGAGGALAALLFFFVPRWLGPRGRRKPPKPGHLTVLPGGRKDEPKLWN